MRKEISGIQAESFYLYIVLKAGISPGGFRVAVLPVSAARKDMEAPSKAFHG